MQNRHLFIAGAGLLLWVSNVRAQYHPNGHGVDEITRQKIALKLKNATTDDFIVELARAADLDFIADGTDLPQTGLTMSGEFSDHFGDLIDDVWPGKRELTCWREDKRTFLFWAMPDLVSLTRRIVNGEEITRVPKTMDNRALRDALSDYLRQHHAFDGEKVGQSVRVAFADMPPPLRQAMIAFTQADNLPTNPRHLKAQMSDEFWRQARLKIGKEPLTLKPRKPWLFASGPAPEVKDGRTWLGTPFDPNGKLPEEPLANIYETKTTALTVAVDKAEIADELSATALQNETALQVKVSIEVKQRPLGDLLSELQAQSAVMLACAPNCPDAAMRVTARVKEMPLANLLNAFSRLYGVRWNRNGDKSYLMHAGDLNSLEREVVKQGDPQWSIRGRRSVWNLGVQEKQLGMLWREVIGEAGAREANSREGVALSELSEELQRGFRQIYERQVAEDVAHTRFQFLRRTIADYAISARTEGRDHYVDGKKVVVPHTEAWIIFGASGSKKPIDFLIQLSPPPPQSKPRALPPAPNAPNAAQPAR